MENEHLIKPSILKSLEKNKNFRLKQFLGDGKFSKSLLLEDIFTKQKAIGKIVTIQNDGEFRHWPSLRHESLIPLLEIVTINNEKSIFVCPFTKTRLRLLIEEMGFLQHPKCFDRKKSYVKDVLSGLVYLHQLPLSLMNLTIENVLICGKSDRALISDFSCSVSMKSISKSEYPNPKIKLLLPPELEDNNAVDCTPIDMWLCGIMVLQAFTRSNLPRTDDLLNGLTLEHLRQANTGSYLLDNDVTSLQEFLETFLSRDPENRIGAKEAITSPFLQNSTRRLDEQARDFWKIQDAFELLSKADRADLILLKGGQRSHVHTIRDRKNFEYETKVQPLRNLPSENRSCKKAKSELYTEKDFQHVEGKTQSHANIAFLNYLYENSTNQNNDAASEVNVEPYSINDSVTSSSEAPRNKFQLFSPSYQNEATTEGNFDPRLEKDPWQDKNERNRVYLNPDNSKTHMVTQTVNFQNLTSPDNSDENYSTIVHYPSATEINSDSITKASSPISKTEISPKDFCEQFHSEMTLKDDFPCSITNSCEPCAYNPQSKFQTKFLHDSQKLVMNEQFQQGTVAVTDNNFTKITHEPPPYNEIPDSEMPPYAYRRFSNSSWQYRPDEFKRTSSNRIRRNPYNIKMGTKLKNQFRSRPYPPQTAETPPPNCGGISSYDQMKKNKSVFAFLHEGYYNLERPVKGHKKLVSGTETLAKTVEAENGEVDIPLDLTLCPNSENMNKTGTLQRSLKISKRKGRFVRMLCPGRKIKTVA